MTAFDCSGGFKDELPPLKGAFLPVLEPLRSVLKWPQLCPVLILSYPQVEVQGRGRLPLLADVLLPAAAPPFHSFPPMFAEFCNLAFGFPVQSAYLCVSESFYLMITLLSHGEMAPG